MHTPDTLLSLLDSLDISYERYEHHAVFTCDESTGVVPDDPSIAHTKNLFMRDKRGRRHILLVTTCATQIDLKSFAAQAAADRLSFASPERMLEHLGVTPGSVTVMALANDTRKSVEVFIDRAVWESPRLSCHPLVNTATVVLDHDGLEKFLAATGHDKQVVGC